MNSPYRPFSVGRLGSPAEPVWIVCQPASVHFPSITPIYQVLRHNWLSPHLCWPPLSHFWFQDVRRTPGFISALEHPRELLAILPLHTQFNHGDPLFATPWREYVPHSQPLSVDPCPTALHSHQSESHDANSILVEPSWLCQC